MIRLTIKTKLGAEIIRYLWTDGVSDSRGLSFVSGSRAVALWLRLLRRGLDSGQIVGFSWFKV